MASKKTDNNVGTAVAVSAGVAAIGIVSYFLMGPNGKKNRKNVSSWMLRMKGDIIEKMEEAKEVTGPLYQSIVDEVGEKYKSIKNLDPMAVAAEIATLKKGWKSMMPAKKVTAKKVVVATKKVVKKAVSKNRK